MVPFVTSESAVGQNVCKFVSGVDIFDLDLWVKIDLVKKKTIEAQLCGFGVRVSLSDFCL